MAKKNSSKGSPFDFVNVTRRKKKQRIAFGILTALLAIGLVGGSMSWSFGGKSKLPSGAGTDQQQQDVNVDERIAELESQFQENPKDTDLMTELAGLYWQNGKAQQAADMYLQALEIKPGDAKLLKDLGLTYYLMGNYGDAVTRMEEAVKQSPADAEAHYLLGQFYAYRSDEGRDIDKGIAQLEEFIRLQKEGIDVEKAQGMIEDLKSEK